MSLNRKSEMNMGCLVRRTHKICGRCGELYDVSPFACMLGNGARADATIQVYEENYNLCPKCAHELWLFLNKNKQG